MRHFRILVIGGAYTSESSGVPRKLLHFCCGAGPPPNKALQPTANPLRGLSAAELGR